MIDVIQAAKDGELIDLADLATLIDRHPTTVLRWHTNGYHGVKLEATRLGLRYCTTHTAFNEFRSKTNPQEVAEVPVRTPSRKRQIAEAVKIAQRMGMKVG